MQEKQQADDAGGHQFHIVCKLARCRQNAGQYQDGKQRKSEVIGKKSWAGHGRNEGQQGKSKLRLMNLWRILRSALRRWSRIGYAFNSKEKWIYSIVL